MSIELPPLPGSSSEASPKPGAPPVVLPPVPDAVEELEEVENRLSDRVEGLSCPNCGGNLEIETGLRVVSCPYCRTPLLVRSEIGTRRFAIEPRVGAGRAREVATRWLGKGMRKDPRLKREARLGEAFLCFLPFFRVEADAVGVALGTELRRRTVGSGKNRRVQTYEADVERKLERSMDRTYPAINVGEWGIQKFDLTGDPLVPFDGYALARQGMVFPSIGSEHDVLDGALEGFKREADPATGLHRVSFRFFQTLRERLSVIYYPIWVVRYHFNARAYQILVDGEDGALAFGKAPGNDLYRALMLVATEAVAMFFATTALQLMGASLPGLAILGGLGFAMVLWGWRRFRYGGVVIEGSGTKKEIDLTKTLSQAVRSGSSIQAARAIKRGLLPGSGD